MNRTWILRSLWLLPVAVVILAVPLVGPEAHSTGGPGEPLSPQDELDPNDFRISSTGPDSDTNYYALDPAVAYNPTASEYLVVWAADDDAAPVAEDEFEIYAQRVDAATGALLGARLRVSQMGSDGDTGYYARDPAVAYDATANQYLVVWAADDDAAGLADDEFEIYGQLLTAAGAQTGTNDFRISAVGTDGDPDSDALNPAVVYNPDASEYLVVWQADGVAPLTDNAVEIYGQRISAAGAPVGPDDFRVSDMGADDTDTTFRAQDPAVAYNPTAGRYLVVWEGVDDTPPLTSGEVEIFGQLLAADGSAVGGNDFRISDMGPDGDPAYAADNPAVTCCNLDDEYLVVWSGDDNRDFGDGPLADGEFEVYGQRLAADGSHVGDNDFRISHMGPDGDPAYKTHAAGVVHIAARDWYLVVWRGDDDRDFGAGALADDEMEVFGQMLDDRGAFLGPDLRLSDLGPDGDAAFDADRPALAASGDGSTMLVVWQGDDDGGTLVEGEVEVFGQLYALESMLNVGVVKSAAPGTVAPGQPVTYTLDFANTGGQLATGVVLTDIVPVELSDLAYTSSGATIAQANAGVLTYTWSVGDLSPGERGTIMLTGLITRCLPGGYLIENTASIATPLTDVNSGDNESTAGVTILNAAPIAAADAYAAVMDTPLSVPVGDGVLVSDSDLNCDPLSAVLDDAPVNGLLTFNPDGSFNYSPAPGFVGVDGFSYHAHDGLTDSNVAAVTLIVGDDVPPQVSGISPADGATEVAIGATVIITFNEIMDTSSLHCAVAPDPGGWSLAWSAGDTVATLTHNPFDYAATWTTIVSEATDLAGNPLFESVQWSFSTRPFRLFLPIVLRDR